MADLDPANVITTLGTQEDIVKAKYYVGDPTDISNTHPTPDYTWTFTKDTNNVITNGSGASIYSIIKGNRTLVDTAVIEHGENLTKINTNKTDIGTIKSELVTVKADITQNTTDINDAETKIDVNTTWRTTNTPKLGDLSSYPDSNGLSFVQVSQLNHTKISTNETAIDTIEANISSSFPYKNLIMIIEQLRMILPSINKLFQHWHLKCLLSMLLVVINIIEPWYHQIHLSGMV